MQSVTLVAEDSVDTSNSVPGNAIPAETHPGGSIPGHALLPPTIALHGNAADPTDYFDIPRTG
jgi:hypothetical protein